MLTKQRAHRGSLVAPRRLARCVGCNQETLQWLTHVDPSSPGSYRGTRLLLSYTCSECGEVNYQ